MRSRDNVSERNCCILNSTERRLAKKTTPLAIIARVKSMKIMNKETTPLPRHADTKNINVAGQTTVILTDTSCYTMTIIGVGIAIFDQTGMVLTMVYNSTMALNPLQADTEALSQGLKIIQAQSMQVIEAIRMIISDGTVLVDAAVRRNCIEDLLSWQGAQKVAQCARLYQDIKNTTTLSLCHVTRKALQQERTCATGVADKQEAQSAILPSCKS